MKKYILAAVLFISTGIFAQSQDSLLRRQMELQREFNPTLQDANKINSLPSIPQPSIQKANTAYSNWTNKITPPLEIAMPQPNDIMTEIPYNRQKGYITLGAGNYGNIGGAVGYRIIDNKNNNLSFKFLHNSSNGEVSYTQESNPQSNKLFRMDNVGTLAYSHLFSAFMFRLQGGYNHSAFNYYANTFGDKRTFNNETQTLGVFNLGADFESVKSDYLNYRGHLYYKNFSGKFGQALNETGLKGNQTDALFGIDKPFNDGDARIGLDGKLLSVFYNSNSISNFMLAGAVPYIAFEGLNWKAKLGAKLQFQILGGPKFRVAPDIELSLGVTEHSSVYADIKGGINDNTYLSMINQSRYIAPMTAVKASTTILDLQAGAKIGEISGFRFDIFGGFKKVNDEHFLILNHVYHGAVSNPYPFHVVENLLPVYGNLSHPYIGGMLQTNIWAPLNIAIQAKKNFYTVKNLTINNGLISDAKAYNKPGFEVDMKASFEALKNLKFTLNYCLAGDRWTYFNAMNVKMPNIHDLNIGAVYNISNAFSIHAKANNIFSQKYDIGYGHPAQGFNAMGGFTFLF